MACSTISVWLVAKAVINQLWQGVAPNEPFRVGLEFGTFYRGMDWGRGLTTHACTMNLIPFLDSDDHPLALFHGLADVASDTAGMSPRFNPRPLPNEETDIATLKQWFRQFVEVRDAQAGERAIVSALQAGADNVQIADMLFAAATDHRYLDAGHTLDFVNKALESVDLAGWDYAELAFTSVVPNLADARRMEESNAWRKPIDLVRILQEAFVQLPSVMTTCGAKAAHDMEAVTATLLGDDPQLIVDTLLDCLRSGTSPLELSGTVSYAAARRIAHFHTSNEFGDWDTALHTFTFANAVQQGLARIESLELTRGIFDAAMSCYLDRFLNVPSVKLPQPPPIEDPRCTAGRAGNAAQLAAASQSSGYAGCAISVQRRFARSADGENGPPAFAGRPGLSYHSVYRSKFQSIHLVEGKGRRNWRRRY